MLHSLINLVPIPAVWGMATGTIDWPAAGGFVAVIVLALLAGAALELSADAWKQAHGHPVLHRSQHQPA